MHKLKDYQQRTIDALRMYFALCSGASDAKVAFELASKAQFGMPIPYREVGELPGLPYVCLRIPTGGGKTLVACHSVGVAVQDLLHANTAVVLWLVPSNTIRDQTLAALKDRTHPYRQALEAGVNGAAVLDVEDALYVRRATLDGATTVIVSTLQSFRVEDTVGRRVYRQDGNLGEHFDPLPEQVAGSVERYGNGKPVPSLANVLCVRRPIVIVDEAHNARTDLSFETLARFNPSCIIEFSATPAKGDHASNVLHSVSAAELKAEQMIKMPIRLETRPDWQELLSDAIRCRGRLEKAAWEERRTTGEYIRPIMLLQAQPREKGDPSAITVDRLLTALLIDHKVPREEIAVATGEQRELDAIEDISKDDCRIRYVITVQALREGWDCPFAYVLCSVAEMRSSTYVEQILGRVMRLPKAELKRNEDLNSAYAFSASADFNRVATALQDGLVSNGFERQEAEEFVVRAGPEGGQDVLWTDDSLWGVVKVTLDEIPDMSGLDPEIAAKVIVDADTKTLVFRGIMRDEDCRQLKHCVATQRDRASIDRAYQLSNARVTTAPKSPSQMGVRLDVPVLAVKQGEFFEQFEETHLLERHWELANCDPTLSESDYSSERPGGQTGLVYVTDTGDIRSRFIGTLHEQMRAFDDDSNWSIADLVLWLEKATCAASWRHEFTQEESGIFLTRLVQTLSSQRGIPLSRLVNDKYRLRQAVARKITALREEARRQSYQSLLRPDCMTPLVVRPDVCFSYAPGQYPYSARYTGRYRFDKHYYPEVGDLRAEGEEFECAQQLDQRDSIEVWVRNIANRPHDSFWLQTSTDKFYPDFVCRLKDGRYLVVEYKGEGYVNQDAEEKKNLGELWEKRSNGLCRFAMPVARNWHEIDAAIGR